VNCSGQKRSLSTFCTTALAITSQSTTGTWQPSSSAVTVLFPVAMPPVRPTILMPAECRSMWETGTLLLDAAVSIAL